MVTVSSIYLSRRDSKWWYLACLGWSLGFLQKSPIALFVAVCLMIGLSFTIKQDGFKFSELRRDRHFLWSWMVGAFICTAYIGLKLYQYGYESIKEAFVHQIIHRFIPAMPNDPERHRGWGFIFYHLIQDGIVYWTLSFLALITFIFLKRKLLSGKEWLILCYIALVFSVFVLSGGIIYFRYMTVLIPFIVIFVSIAITDVFRSSGKVQWILAGIMFVSSFPVYQREWRE